jgi:DNA-binding IclR family transcriptional regulator
LPVRDPEKSNYAQRVPAVDQAMEILFCLAEAPAGEASLAYISRTVGVHKSKAHAILNTLRSGGLVVRREPAPTYALGPAVLTLSRSLLDRNDLGRRAEPFLAPLAAETGATALLGLLTAGQVFVVGQEGSSGLGIAIRVGHRYPLTWGAHGRAILAHLTAERRREILRGRPLYLNGPSEDALDEAALREELAECRRRGYALDLERVEAGVSALSAPLLDPAGRPWAVLILVGSFPEAQAHVLGERVVAAAREMSFQLGPFREGAG